MGLERFGAFLSTTLFPDDMFSIAALRYLKIFLGAFAIILLSYNFYVANNYKYKAEGDAASFIELGAGLAKMQKYGHLTHSGSELLAAFKANKIVNGNIEFLGHSTWRPPVWPFLIAGIFLIFGYNLIYILIFKYLLHLIGVFIFYKTLKLLKLNELIIIIGSFLYAVSPAWQIYSRVFLSEPITLFFLTLWVYLLIRYLQEKSNFLSQALVGGILILSHPYYILFPFSVWFILWLLKNIQFKGFIISSIICASIVSIWIVRNFIVLQTNEIVVTTSSGAVMAKGWNYDVLDEHTNTKGDLANETLVLEDYQFDRSRSYNEVERMKLYKDATLHFIRSNPDLIFPIISSKLLSAFNPFPETSKPGILETGRWIFQFLALLALIYILSFNRNKILRSLVLGLILSTVGITILTYSGFRFRMPQVGLEILFIVYVVDDILKKRQARRRIPGMD